MTRNFAGNLCALPRATDQPNPESPQLGLILYLPGIRAGTPGGPPRRGSPIPQRGISAAASALGGQLSYERAAGPRCASTRPAKPRYGGPAASLLS